MSIVRCVPLLLLIGFAYCQAPGQKAQPLAGCYEVTSLPSNPRDKNIAVIPKEIELRNEPRWNALALQRVSREGNSNNFENSWNWKPQGIEKVAVNFSNGLGGLRGTPKKSKNGDLTGKLKEWCDFRCAYTEMDRYCPSSQNKLPVS